MRTATNITLGIELKKRVTIYCEQRDISLSELLNRLVEKHLETEEAKKMKAKKSKAK